MRQHGRGCAGTGRRGRAGQPDRRRQVRAAHLRPALQGRRRPPSGSRGLSSDLVLLDELREHRDWEAWGSSTKTTLARPSPQVLGFSNAGDAGSVVLSSLRDKALAAAADRSTTVGIFEWSAADGCALDDRAAWAQANPALGDRMSEQAIASALEVDPEAVPH